MTNVVPLLIPDDLPLFEDFWIIYTRKVRRKDARTAWDRMTQEQQLLALVAVVEWRKVWATMDEEYIPHASTWLRAERWDDELPKVFKQANAAHAPAKLPDSPARTVIPDHVRALLAKLRGKV